jgi:hypothetical protein
VLDGRPNEGGGTAYTGGAVAQRAGFSLSEIRELLESSEEGQVSERLKDSAERKLPEVEELIARAEAMKTWLETATGCNCSTLDVCGLFEENRVAPDRADAAIKLTAVRAGVPTRAGAGSPAIPPTRVGRSSPRSPPSERWSGSPARTVTATTGGRPRRLPRRLAGVVGGSTRHDGDQVRERWRLRRMASWIRW